jgi:hypothetical protein
MEESPLKSAGTARRHMKFQVPVLPSAMQKKKKGDFFSRDASTAG